MAGTGYDYELEPFVFTVFRAYGQDNVDYMGATWWVARCGPHSIHIRMSFNARHIELHFF